MNVQTNQPPTFAIGIPTINQWPLLKKHIGSYIQDFPETKLFILDNGKQTIDLPAPHSASQNIIIIRETENIGVAASWNKLCKEIYSAGHSHALIVNDDIYPCRTAEFIQGMLDLIHMDFYKSSRDDWSIFILPEKTFRKIGGFDTQFFPAYFEDRDYMYRMKLAGCSKIETIRLDPGVFKESQSSKKDPSLLDNFDRNEKLYIDKWGGKPGFEKYRIAYGGRRAIM